MDATKTAMCGSGYIVHLFIPAPHDPETSLRRAWGWLRKYTSRRRRSETCV
jgi:hypothetical protein